MSREIEDLDTRFQPRAQAWLEIMQRYVLPLQFNGYKIEIRETFRDAARQEMLMNQGASKVKVGYHNFGLAFDFIVFDAQGIYDVNDASGAYKAGGLVAEALGCEWGGRWKDFADLGHIQFRPGAITIADLQARMITA